MSQWYVNDSGREVGPLSSAELKRMAGEGRIRPDTWLRQVGQGGWIPASRVKGLFDGAGTGELPPPAYGHSPITHTAPAPAPMLAATNFGPSHYGQSAPQQVPAHAYQSAEPPPPPPRRTRSASKGFPVVLLAVGGGGVVLALIAFVAVGIWLLRPKPKKVPLSNEQIVERSEKSIAALRGKINGGTGFLVKPGILATNAHVIETEFVENLKAEFPAAGGKQGKPRVQSVIYCDTQRDLALIRIKSEIESLRLAGNYEHRRGESVLVIGNPGFADGHLSNAPTPGMMGSETTLRGFQWYQLSVNLNPGNSGGPVFDKFGDVIGIATSTARGKAALGFCIPAEDVSKALGEVEGMTEAQEKKADLRHRARSTVKMLEFVCEKYNDGLKEYIAEMEKAQAQNINVNQGVRIAQTRIAALVALYDAVLTADVKPNMSRFNDRSSLEPTTRHQLRDLWTTYEEMKDYFEKPRGTLDSFRAKRIEMYDRYLKLSKGLQVELG